MNFHNFESNTILNNDYNFKETYVSIGQYKLLKPMLCAKHGRSWDQVRLESIGYDDKIDIENLKKTLTNTTANENLVNGGAIVYSIINNNTNYYPEYNNTCYYDYLAHLMTISIKFPSDDHEILLIMDSPRMKNIVTEYNNLVRNIIQSEYENYCYKKSNKKNICINDLSISVDATEVDFDNNNTLNKDSIYRIVKDIRHKRIILTNMTHDYMTPNINKIEEGITLLNKIDETLFFGKWSEYDDMIGELMYSIY